MRWLVPVLEGMTNAGLDAELSAADARWLAAKMMAGVAALALETDLSYEEMLSLTSLQVVNEEEISLIFYEAAHRARERAEEMTRDLARND
jgi:pyrroline-5-carboxylate reductase